MDNSPAVPRPGAETPPANEDERRRAPRRGSERRAQARGKRDEHPEAHRNLRDPREPHRAQAGCGKHNARTHTPPVFGGRRQSAAIWRGALPRMRARSRSNGRANLKGPGRSTSYGFSMGSEHRLTEAAASLAAALRRRRRPGTHCLQVTMCHGGAHGRGCRNWHTANRSGPAPQLPTPDGTFWCGR